MPLLFFRHAALLGGLGLTALPPLIHWLGRRGLPTRPFAALHLLRRGPPAWALSERWRNVAVLVLRALCLAALVFALARPQEPTAAAVALPAAVAPQPAPSLQLRLVRPLALRPGDAPLQKEVVLQVRNDGSTLQQGASVRLWVDGELQQRGRFDLPPAQPTDYAFTVAFAAAGRRHLRACVALGAAPGVELCRSDVLEVAGPLQFLAVAGAGDGRGGRGSDAPLYFVERAMQQVPAREAPMSVRIVPAASLTPEDFAAVDAVLLAGVAELPSAALLALRHFVAAGGGLLFSTGPQLQFERANAHYGDLLAHTLRDQENACAAGAGLPPVGIEVVDGAHPAWQGLGTDWARSLRSARVCRYFNVEMGSHRAARTLLRFDNGAPALLEALPQPSAPAAGRRLLLTTSLSRQEGDLPVRAAFVPLLQRLLRHAASPVTQELSAASASPAQEAHGAAATLAPEAVETPPWSAWLLLCVAGLWLAECLAVAYLRRG